VLDFGLARIRDAARITQTDEVLGTPAYMAPEQVQGLEVGTAADVWALGAVMYEMLAGKQCFERSNFLALAHAITGSEPEPLDVLRPDLPMALVELVMSCLAKDPERRPASMPAMGDALRALAE